MFGAQGLSFIKKCQQAIDIGMLSRIGARVLGVLGKDLKPFLCCLRGNRPVGCLLYTSRCV